jgi:hypothetical protein
VVDALLEETQLAQLQAALFEAYIELSCWRNHIVLPSKPSDINGGKALLTEEQAERVEHWLRWTRERSPWAAPPWTAVLPSDQQPG